jgi:hypothetical protein
VSGRTDELGAVNSCVTMPTHARQSASVSDISQSYQQYFKPYLLFLVVAVCCMDEHVWKVTGESYRHHLLLYTYEVSVACYSMEKKEEAMMLVQSNFLSTVECTP